MTEDADDLRDRALSVLRPLFDYCETLEFKGGSIFRGPASDYCLSHRQDVERGLDELPGDYTFENLDGQTYLTYTLPGPKAKGVNYPLHVGLLAATVVTTLVAGTQWRFDQFVAEAGASLLGRGDSVPLGELLEMLLVQGGTFSAAILAIFGCHEFGHYAMARRYGMLVTPPFFLPGPPPFPPFGTFGAIIRIRSPMMHRRALLDVGLAGPLSGMAVALPILVYGLAQSDFVNYWDQGTPMRFGHSLLTWGLTRWLVGTPPAGYVLDWMANPFAWAGWLGLLVTALNLMPVGQLDGGHVAYALFGRRQRQVAFFCFGALLALAVTQFQPWVVWCAVMALWMKPAHPPVAIDEVRLNPARRALGWCALGLLILVFLPAPVVGLS
ncbi:MAG: site-2 protease family protein [Planctomycetota bacterium]